MVLFVLKLFLFEAAELADGLVLDKKLVWLHLMPGNILIRTNIVLALRLVHFSYSYLALELLTLFRRLRDNFFDLLVDSQLKMAQLLSLFVSIGFFMFTLEVLCRESDFKSDAHFFNIVALTAKFQK
jgi:hypothetical protein